jgi:hypothetical protein
MHSSENMKSVVKYIQDQDEAIFLEPLPKMPCRPRELTRKDWRRIMKNSGEFRHYSPNTFQRQLKIEKPAIETNYALTPVFLQFFFR